MELGSDSRFFLWYLTHLQNPASIQPLNPKKSKVFHWLSISQDREHLLKRFLFMKLAFKYHIKAHNIKSLLLSELFQLLFELLHIGLISDWICEAVTGTLSLISTSTLYQITYFTLEKFILFLKIEKQSSKLKNCIIYTTHGL